MEFRLFVGIDWGSQLHQVCALDSERTVIGERAVEHSGRGLAELAEWLVELCDGSPNSVAVGIEQPHGAVVDTMLERGFAVFAINPKQLDRFRDRHTVAGAKDDRRDAFVLADSLRTDMQCFRPLCVDDPCVIELRELSRADETLREECRRLANRLRDLLQRYYPQMLRLSPAADEPWLWVLLDKAPAPALAQHLRPGAVKKVLRGFRIRRLDAKAVLTELQAPPLVLAPGTVSACVRHVTLLLPRLRVAYTQRNDCGRQIAALLDQLANEPTDDEMREHRDVEILRSLPGVGGRVAATMLAEASQPLAARDYQSLRALVGVAPVTKQSGKSRVVRMRYGCNPRLRDAVYHWSRVSIQHDPYCRITYDALRQRGHNHARALRGLVDRLLRILVAMLNNDALYDPSRPRRFANVLHALGNLGAVVKTMP